MSFQPESIENQFVENPAVTNFRHDLESKGFSILFIDRKSNDVVAIHAPKNLVLVGTIPYNYGTESYRGVGSFGNIYGVARKAKEMSQEDFYTRLFENEWVYSTQTNLSNPNAFTLSCKNGVFNFIDSLDSAGITFADWESEHIPKIFPNDQGAISIAVMHLALDIYSRVVSTARYRNN